MSTCDDIHIRGMSLNAGPNHVNRNLPVQAQQNEEYLLYVDSLPHLNDALKQLPEYEAPQSVIDRTFKKIADAEHEQQQTTKNKTNNRANQLAAGISLAATVLLIYQLTPKSEIYFAATSTSDNTEIHKIRRLDSLGFPIVGNSHLTDTIPQNSALVTGTALVIEKNNDMQTAATDLLAQTGLDDSYLFQSTMSALFSRSLVSAKEFIIAIEETGNLHFLSPTGYWRNAYLPQDIQKLLVLDQLHQWARNGHYQLLGKQLSLEKLGRANSQPFDKPENTSLAIYLQTDQVDISGPTRMRVQVGIQAGDAKLNGIVTGNSDLNDQIVARALTLTINLADNVKLIDVIGSSPIDTYPDKKNQANYRSPIPQFDNNRKIPAKFAREHGIKILIPEFLATDSHIILIDILAESPGPIADVSLKYTDLLHRRKAILQNHLSLDTGQTTFGPLQANVTKNLITRKLVHTLQEVSDILETRDMRTALDKLETMKLLLADLRQNVPTLYNDQDLLRDESMLAQFIAAFRVLKLTNEQQLWYLRNSIKLVSWRKLDFNQPAEAPFNIGKL